MSARDECVGGAEVVGPLCPQCVEPGGLVLMNRSTGEAIDITAATDLQLAEIVDAITALRGTLADEESAISDELLERMDAQGEYTLHVGYPGGRRWKVTAPSKKRGTTRVDTALLLDELRLLVKAEKIAPELARKACKRTVTIVAEVDVLTDLGDLKGTLSNVDKIASTGVYNVKVTTDETVVDAGIKRLERAGHEDSVASCTLPVAPPKRKASVKAELDR